MMTLRSKITATLVVLLAMATGFFVGRLREHYQTGYFYKVHESKTYNTAVGAVNLMQVSESIGMPFLDPGKSIIEYNGKTLFKVTHVFQESYPFVSDLIVSNNVISWNDGEARFYLTMETNQPKIR